MFGVIKLKKDGFQEGAVELLRGILEKDLADAVMVSRKTGSGNAQVQSLVSDPADLQSCSPVSPVMGMNTAKLISDITRLGPSEKKIAVVLKPCEMRALVELAKLNQASLENIITISMDCMGTYSITDYNALSGGGKDPDADFTKSVSAGKMPADVRNACVVCDQPVSSNADLNLCLAYPEPSKELVVVSNTPAGDEILKGLGLSGKDISEDRTKALDKMLAPRIKARDEMIMALSKQLGEDGIAPLQEFFSTCISCHNCVSVCPICYCRECFFEGTTFEYESKRFLRSAGKKGSIKMPTDTLLFHITRFAHMVTSCTACGMCEQACPGGIPLLSIYKMVGKRAQDEFDYVPGRDLAEEMPLTTFKEEELQPR
jgi:formate dehydrogenase subunit beta